MSDISKIVLALRPKIDKALRLAFSCCDPVPRLKGFSRPLGIVGTKALFSQFNDEWDAGTYDYVIDGMPWGYPSRSLLSMNWCGMGGTTLSYHVIRVDEQTSIYFRSQDDEDEHHHLVACARLPNASKADSTFLGALLKSNGRVFRTPIFGSPPCELVVAIDRKCLPSLVYPAFKDAFRTNNDEIWNELVEILAREIDEERDWSKALTTRAGKLRLLRLYTNKVVDPA